MPIRAKYIIRVSSALGIIFCLIAYACNSEGRISEGSKKHQSLIKPSVTAKYETDPVPAGIHEDSADDPAIYVAAQHPDSIYIIGTNKKGGVGVYTLKGKELHYYSFGKANNVDVRYGFPYKGGLIDIVAFSNRSSHSTDIYQIDKSGALHPLSVGQIVSDFSDEVYGFCLYKNPQTNNFYAFINCKQGSVEQYHFWSEADTIGFKKVRAFKLPSQTEGMVADDAQDVLYIGEEKSAIWKYGADPKHGTRGTVLKESIIKKNPLFRADIEGLALYPTTDSTGYLLASIQGNYSYALFEREGDNKYLGSFKVVDGIVDGVEETDGLEAINIKLPEFPEGFAIVHDGYNYDGEELKAQNFKVIDWQQIKQAVLNR